jgi:hypothetical protein
LVKNGIPYDLAYSMNDIRRTALAIIFSTMEGHEFDWNTMTFKEDEEV